MAVSGNHPVHGVVFFKLVFLSHTFVALSDHCCHHFTGSTGLSAVSSNTLELTEYDGYFDLPLYLFLLLNITLLSQWLQYARFSGLLPHQVRRILFHSFFS